MAPIRLHHLLTTLLCSTAFAFTPFILKSNSINKGFATELMTNAGNSAFFRSTTYVTPTTTKLHARKRRKRKDDPTNNDPTRDAPTFIDNSEDELPDFDIDDDADESSSATETSTSPSLSMDLSDAMSDPSVRAAMQGSASSSALDARDVLRSRNREVESTFEFDEVPSPLPRPGQAKGMGGEKVGKKRAKAELRRAAAIERAQLEEDEGPGIFSSISDLFTGKATDGGIPKFVETGTWASIFVLILWEVYINSPLFERAQPMIPVIYDLLN